MFALAPVWLGYVALTTLEGCFVPWSPATASLFTWFVNAPNEELSKWGVFIVGTKALKSLRRPLDGWFQGAFLGLGYGLAESIPYAAQKGLLVFVERLATAVPAHVFYGAIWGGYYAWEVCQGKGKVRHWSSILLALGITIVFHAAFNSSLSGPWGILGAVLIEVLAGALALTLGWFLYPRPRHHVK